MIIYGAGMAGLLAAHMLRRHSPVVYEAAKALPDNHGALLRFRSLAVQRATGIPFKDVLVHKGIYTHGGVQNTATLADSNRYSLNVTGEVMTRSIIDLNSVTRYIAPPDFLHELAKDAKIEFARPLSVYALEDRSPASDPVISTIPMPALMSMVSWPNVPEFKFRQIWAMKARIVSPAVDVYQTIYYPSGTPHYRASITGDQIIVECMSEMDESCVATFVRAALHDFGIKNVEVTDFKVKHQYYGKILPIDERVRKEFIVYMSDKYNVYSVGRFATWRQLLLDDVVEDVTFVERFITERASYSRRLHHVTGK